MSSQTYTFFFAADPHRATDRSQVPTWTLPPVTSSAPRPFTWARATA